MSKITIVALLVMTIASLHPAQGDLMSDLMNSSQALELKGLDILKVLLNPSESLEQKLGQLLLNHELSRLTERGEDVDLTLEKINTMDVGYVYTINADLTDSEEKTKSCTVTIWVRFLHRITDLTFDCKGQSPIVKHITW